MRSAMHREKALRQCKAGFLVVSLGAAALAAGAASAQTPDQTFGTQSCGIDVVFEPIGVQNVLGVGNAYHAVIVVVAASNRTVMAFEANPTGRFPNWGTLIGSVRNHPFASGSITRRAAPLNSRNCGQYLNWMRNMLADLNSSRIPYKPTPIPPPRSDGANSNSFVFWVLHNMGLTPPPAPSGTYGYNRTLIN